MQGKFKKVITKPELDKAISIMGGIVFLSQKLGIKRTNICNWLYSDRKIPIKHAIAIEKLTKGKISAKNLRPDIFKYDLKL